MWPDQNILRPSSSSKLNSLQLLWFRLFSGVVIWFSCAYIYLDRDGLTLDVATRDKLIKRMVLHGFERFSPFTVWCWSLLGLYFFMVSVAGIADIMNNEILLAITSSSPYVRMCTVLFEVSFSVAFLVSSIVTYVLIPGCEKQGVPVDAFYKPFSLLFHNANVVFACLESLINTITFVPSHFVFVVLWGTMYVVFSWAWFRYSVDVVSLISLFSSLTYPFFMLIWQIQRSILLFLSGLRATTSSIITFRIDHHGRIVFLCWFRFRFFAGGWYLGQCSHGRVDRMCNENSTFPYRNIT